MGSKLIAVGRRLAYLLGLGFVTDSAPSCCCPGGTPGCQCQNGPGCSIDTSSSFHAIKTDRYAMRPLYLWGPVLEDCCCHQGAGMVRNFRGLDEQYAADDGRVTCRMITEGSGTDGSVTIRTRVWREVVAGGGLVLDFDATRTIQLLQCDPFSTTAGGVPCFVPSFGLGAVGFVRSTCAIREESWVEYFPDLSGALTVLRNRHELRVTLTADRSGCIDNGCTTCCLKDDTCIRLTPEACREQGGIPGTGTDCATSDCGASNSRRRGACCKPDGTCTTTGESTCAAMQGIYHGDGTTCADVICPPPPTRACCLPAGGCAEMTQLQCQQANGTWSPTLHCDAPGICPPPQTGACCFSGGACQDTTEAQCSASGGIWRGAGTACGGPQSQACVGACCTQFGNPSNPWVCLDSSTELTCAINQGIWQGYQTTCAGRICGGGFRESPGAWGYL